MRIKKFECEIVLSRGTYRIEAKNKLLRFFGFSPIEMYLTDKLSYPKVINPVGDYLIKKEAERDLELLRQAEYIEI